jgi:hypothetical protein
VLRDSDATDFARIVNANGAVVHEVKCQSASPSASAAPTAQPTATATPATPRPTVTAAPTAAPIGVVPNGGGPPGTDSWQSGGVLLIGGASVLAAFFGAVVLGRMMSDRPRPVAVAIAQTWSPPVPSRRATHHYGRLLYLFLVLVLAALVGASGSSARGRRR